MTSQTSMTRVGLTDMWDSNTISPIQTVWPNVWSWTPTHGWLWHHQVSNSRCTKVRPNAFLLCHSGAVGWKLFQLIGVMGWCRNPCLLHWIREAAWDSGVRYLTSLDLLKPDFQALRSKCLFHKHTSLFALPSLSPFAFLFPFSLTPHRRQLKATLVFGTIWHLSLSNTFPSGTFRISIFRLLGWTLHEDVFSFSQTRRNSNSHCDAETSNSLSLIVIAPLSLTSHIIFRYFDSFEKCLW